MTLEYLIRTSAENVHKSRHCLRLLITLSKSVTCTFIWNEPDAKFKLWTEIETRDDIAPSIHREKLFTSLSCWEIRNIIATKLSSL